MAFGRLGESLDKASLQDRFARQEENKRVSKPEQLLALQIADELDDREHKAIYLALCKKTAPGIIAEARSFVSDAQARNKAKLFMWKVKQLRAEWQAAGKMVEVESLGEEVGGVGRGKKRRRRRVEPAQLFDE